MMIHFDNVKYISNGRYSDVYRAFNIETGKEFALKIVDKKYTTIVQNEINILSKINNTSVPQFYKCIQTDKKYIIIMDLCCGEELCNFVNVNREIVELATLKTIFINIAKIMSKIHKMGIVHRDLKLENIIVGKFGYISIVDWGMAMELFNSIDAGGFSGTRYYLSPEVLYEKRICFGNDVWAFGVMIMMCYTHHEPFLNRHEVVNMRPNYDGVPDDLVCTLKKIFVPYANRITFVDILNEPWFKF